MTDLPEPATPLDLEADPRFPSGPWTGYFLQDIHPGRNQMDLHLTFRQGQMSGDGRDLIGPFIIAGRYQISDGQCWWHKRYLGKHDVFYKGYNEGKGIWGVWEIPPQQRGGFHIWPEGMGDPTQQRLSAAADPPLALEEPAGVLVGAAADTGDKD
jgi:hypothetical protein